MPVSTRVGLLNNINPPATTITRVYTAPIATPGGASFMVNSKLTVCNQGAAGTFRVYEGTFQQDNTKPETVRYIAQPIAANATIELPGRDSVDNGGWIEVWSSHANMSWHLFGSETVITP